MSWLNLNDSLNSLKGQITNFANTVLAEDLLENREEVLKESETKCENEARGNEYTTEDPWTWSAVESKTDQLKTDETITNLKKRIEELQNENRDLITSLDQLDQNHQQNSEELVKMKSKLSEELEVVTEKYEILNMKYNKLALAENGYKKKINELKHKCEEITNKKSSDSIKNDDHNSTAKYELLELENLQLKKKIAMLETEQKKLDEEDSDSKLASLTSTVQELQMENKALKIALQTTSNSKATEENESIKKYEDEIAQLRNELENVKLGEPVKAAEASIQEDDALTKEESQDETSEVKKLNEEIIRANEGNEKLRVKYEDVITKLQQELETVQTDRDMEKSRNINQSKEFSTIMDDLKLKLNEANIEITEMKRNYSDLQRINLDLEESKYENENILKDHQEQIAKLKEEISQKKEIEEKSDTHELIFKQCFNMFEEQFKEYLGDEESCPNYPENVEKLNEIFPKRIDKIHAIINDFQQKLENMEISLNERKDLQKDKDEEIERLLDNSEMLTQELSRKSKEIKDIEEECSELMKNNELLISKLNEMKETGLQTIFESNEDNVASMEKQLDDDLKRIEELEGLLAQKEIEKKRIDDEIIEEIKDSQSSAELKRNLKQVEKEKEHLETLLEEVRDKLRVTECERDNCRTVIDKMRLDFETTEYQFSEMNANLETLSEEIEKHKVRIDSLVSENENLKSLRQEDSKNDEDLKLMKQELTEMENLNDILQKELEDNGNKHDLQEREKDEVCIKLRSELDTIRGEKTHLEQKIEEYRHGNEILKKLYNCLSVEFLSQQDALGQEEFVVSKIIERVNEMKEQSENIHEENLKLISELESLKDKSLETENNDVQTELQKLMESRNELIAIIQTKHQETLTYHGEIQRLSEILKQETEKNIKLEADIETLMKNSCPADSLNAKVEEIEKLNDQIDFLRQKCDVLAQSLLEEQQRTENEKLSSSEKEASLNKKLERLQSHLMEVEEHYTQELLQSEQKIASLQARLNEVEKREKDSSTVYTSVSIRANQQNEALTQQLQSMTSQRDDLRKKLLDLEDENNVKSAALSNLQLALSHFQKDKEADVIRETDRVRRQVKHEQSIQEELRKEIANLENQIKESKQGLQAALRLTDQLEMSKNQISTLKEEVSVLTDKLHHREEELKMVTSQTDGKVDKSLIKNLIIGFVTSNKNLNKDQKQILKIIATVLDFNEQDHTKVNLNQAQQNTWLYSLISPVAGDALPQNESLSRAFVNFLENESKPRIIPSLVHQSSTSESSSSVNSSTRTTPTPIVLNEIVLPTFSDFPQHRNSSSILKGVLKDNS